MNDPGGTEPSWELYGTFLAVMREGSLSAAARALAVAQPTARRRIEELERTLGVVLFTRATTGLVPTDAALIIQHHAETMAASASALVRALSASPGDEAGTVRIAASEIIGSEVLPPMLAALAEAAPRLQVELSLSNRNEDLIRRDADVAVRMVAPTQAALVARRVGAIPLGLYASEAYLTQHPAPRSLADLMRGHRLVGADRGRGLITALAAAGIATTPRHFHFRSDNDLAQLAAVRAGLGIGVCQVPLASRTPALHRVLPEVEVPLETWVVMHEDQRQVRRVRVVFEHLVRELGAYIETRSAARAPAPRRATPTRRRSGRRV